MKSNKKNVRNLFMIWLLTDSEFGVIQYADDKEVIQDVVDNLVQDMISPVSAKKWKGLRKIAQKSSVSVTASYCSNYAYAAAAHSVPASYSDFSTVSYYATIAYCHSNLKKHIESDWHIAATNKLYELVENAK